MSYEVFEASPVAKARIETETDCFATDSDLSHHRLKYPFRILKIGECFCVPYAEGNEVSLRSGASNYARQSNGKKFTVIKHNDKQLIEVARIR